MSLNAIGDAVFFTMSVPLKAAAQQLEIESRSGVDGVALWKTGTRGQPFQVATMIDLVGDLATAQNVANVYRAMVGAGPFPMIRADNPLGVVVVLDVDASDDLIVNCVGGVNGGTVILTATWTLIHVG